MKKQPISIRDAVGEIIPVPSFAVEFPVILASVRRLAESQKTALNLLLEKWMLNIGKTVNEKDCLLAAKTLVALIPQSLPTISACLERKRPVGIYELHFSLFCFLDEVLFDKGLRQRKKEVLSLVRGYLTGVDEDHAMAAWMAGDLLGDHWTPQESVPVLCDLHAHADNAVNESAVRHGLQMIAKKKMPLPLLKRVQETMDEKE
jgi:hypothetical protein